MSLPNRQTPCEGRARVNGPQPAPTNLTASAGRPLSHRYTASISPTSPCASEPWPVSNKCRHVVHTVLYRDICKWSGYINDVALGRKITEYEGEAFRRARSTGEYLHFAREVIIVVAIHINCKDEMARVLRGFPADISPDPVRQQNRVFRCYSWVTISLIDQVGVILMSTLKQRGDRSAQQGLTEAVSRVAQNRAPRSSVPPMQVAATSMTPHQTGGHKDIRLHPQNPRRVNQVHQQARQEGQSRLGIDRGIDAKAPQGREVAKKPGTKKINAKKASVKKAAKRNTRTENAAEKNAGPGKVIGKQKGPKRKAKKAPAKNSAQRKTPIARKNTQVGGREAPTRNAVPPSRALPGPSSRPVPWFTQWIAPGHPEFVPRIPPGATADLVTQMFPQLHQGPNTRAPVFNHSIPSEWVRPPQRAMPDTQNRDMPMNGQAPQMPPHQHVRGGQHALQAAYPHELILGPAGGIQGGRHAPLAQMSAAAAGRSLSTAAQEEPVVRAHIQPSKVYQPHLVFPYSLHANILGAYQVGQPETPMPTQIQATPAAAAGNSQANVQARIAPAGIPVMDRGAIPAGHPLDNDMEQQNQRLSRFNSEVRPPVGVQRTVPSAAPSVSNPLCTHLLQPGPSVASCQGQLKTHMPVYRVSSAPAAKNHVARVPFQVPGGLLPQLPGTTDGNDLITGEFRKTLSPGILEGRASTPAVHDGSGGASPSTKPSPQNVVPEVAPVVQTVQPNGDGATALLGEAAGGWEDAVGTQNSLDADEVFAIFEAVGRECRDPVVQPEGGGGDGGEAVGAALDLESLDLSPGMPDLDLLFQDEIPQTSLFSLSEARAPASVHLQPLGASLADAKAPTAENTPMTMSQKHTSQAASGGKRKASNQDEILNSSLKYIPQGAKHSRQIIRDPRRKKQRMQDAGVVSSVGAPKLPTADVFGTDAVAQWESFSTDFGFLDSLHCGQEDAFGLGVDFDPAPTELGQLVGGQAGNDTDEQSTRGASVPGNEEQAVRRNRARRVEPEEDEILPGPIVSEAVP